MVALRFGRFREYLEPFIKTINTFTPQQKRTHKLNEGEELGGIRSVWFYGAGHFQKDNISTIIKRAGHCWCRVESAVISFRFALNQSESRDAFPSRITQQYYRLVVVENVFVCHNLQATGIRS